CPVVAAGGNEEETDKRINGLLLQGLPIVSIDNIATPLGSSTLCQAVERPRISVRRLGGSDMIEIDARAMFLATGNNLRVRADMVRRVLRSELDANMERPETRRFHADPFNAVLRERDLYLAAAMTIIRAYRVSGTMLDLIPFQSYDEWSS